MKQLGFPFAPATLPRARDARGRFRRLTFVERWRIERAELWSSPARVPDCPGCEVFGLCMLHNLPPDQRPTRGDMFRRRRSHANS